jgi:hypothetical protein
VKWRASPDVSLAATAGHAHGVRDGRIVLCIHSPNQEPDPADVKRPSPSVLRVCARAANLDTGARRGQHSTNEPLPEVSQQLSLVAP